MAFKRGPNYKVYIALENEFGSLDATTKTLVANTSTSGYGPQGTTGLGIGPRTMLTASPGLTECEISNISAIEFSKGWEDDPVTLYGNTREIDNPVRKNWEVTITRKSQDELFALLSNQGRFGITGSTPAIFDARDTLQSDEGYRLLITDGTKDWIGFHGTIAPDGYKLTLTPKGMTDEALTFKGGYFNASVATNSSTVTASRDITQA